MKKQLPKKIHIETVLGCNSRCIMCPNAQEKTVPINIMDETLFKRIVDQIIDLSSIKSIKLSLNGETLLDKKLVDRIKYIKSKKNIRVTFNTNASLLNRSLSKKIIESGLDRINFHVSGFGRENYNKIMAGLDFEKVKSNILTFQELVKSENRKIITAIKFVILKENRSVLPQAKKYWQSRGFLFRPDSLDNRLDSLKAYNDLNFEQSNHDMSACPLIFDHLFIRYNGDVVSCWSDWYGKRIFGNLMKQSIEEIYNTNKFKKLRKEHTKNKLTSNSICANCTWKDKNEK